MERELSDGEDGEQRAIWTQYMLCFIFQENKEATLWPNSGMQNDIQIGYYR